MYTDYMIGALTLALLILTVIVMQLRKLLHRLAGGPRTYGYTCPACKVTLRSGLTPPGETPHSLHSAIATHAFRHGVTNGKRHATMGTATAPDPNGDTP